MTGPVGSVGQLAAELSLVFAPLARRNDEGTTDTLLEWLGLRASDASAGSTALASALRAAAGAAASMPEAVEQLLEAAEDGDSVAVAAATGKLLTHFAAAVQAMNDGAAALKSLSVAPSLTPPQRAEVAAFADEFAQRLLGRLLVEYLEVRFPAVAPVLVATGVVEIVPVTGGPPGSLQASYLRKVLHLDRLTKLVTDPVDLLRNAYGWGEQGFDGLELFKTLQTLLSRTFEIPAEILQPPGEPPLLEAFGFTAELIPTENPPALRVQIRMPTGLDRTDTIKADDWDVTFTTAATFAADLEGTVRPLLDLQLDASSGTVDVNVQASAARSSDAPPFLLLGETGGSRLELKSPTAGVGLELHFDGAADRVVLDPEFSLGLHGGKLVITGEGGDGFIATLLAGVRVESEFDSGLTWSLSRGAQFTGSAGLVIAVPVHLSLGPIEVQTVYLAAGIAEGRVPVELSAGLSAKLGPIQAAVDRLGVLAEFRLPEAGGNLGPLDVGFGFKPPRGVGLSVDAAVIAGGGYLEIDADRGEYAGALELEFANFLELKAIGLITTRMPDGSEGFSLLIVITAEFGSTGIQLGYGFTLLAVGGLIGLNRRMNLQALAEGVRTGRVESVMFPQDVVANAPRILSDLREFFPAEQGKFLIGPMAKIGWGTPPLITVSLGVIIEIPGNIAILGVLRCALPTKEVPLLVLQVSFIGAIEFDKSRLWFFAQLFDSRILSMTIEGGMGLLVGWGDNPDFVLTVGGFHPSFKVPTLPFPVPNRLQVDILNQPAQLIRVSGYFAITSNTVQFGAKAEMRLGFSSFGIEGHFAFDALFQFSPFRFEIAISAGVSLKAFGVGLLSIDLRFQLEGPAPWRARGTGSISILFFEISADFDITWGEKTNTTLPPVEVLALLAAEITKLEGWETRLPIGGTKTLVVLRSLPGTDELVLHPLGALFVRQRSIPLDVRLDRIGAQRPSDGKRFSVAPVPDSGLEQTSVTGDKFAMAQFQDMDDAAKLSRPAYEEQDAGLELIAAGGQLASVRVVRRSARYELHIRDSGAGQGDGALRTLRADRRIAAVAKLNGESTVRRFQNVSPALFNQLLAGSSTSRSPLSQRDAQAKQPFSATDTVRLAPQRFVIAYRRTNLQAFPPGGAGIAATFRSLATALDALAEWVAADASLAGALHVIPESEVAAPLATPGTWSAVAPTPTAASGSVAVRLSSGEMLVAGGADGTGTAVAAVAVFDPVAKTWAAAPPLATPRRLHSATRLDDGRVLVVGGVGASGVPLSSVEVYDPVAKVWAAAGSLATARSAHAAVLLAGKVLVTGGTGTRGTGVCSLSSAELYDPDTGEWAPAAPMTDARSGHPVVVLEDGRVLVVGGALATGGAGQEAALAYCELYDATSGTWTPTGGLGTPRKGHEATVLADGSVLATGGDAPGIPIAGVYRLDSLASAERYDPEDGAWEPVEPMPGGRARHRSVLLRSGRALVVGGAGGPRHAAGFRNATTFDPATGSWTAIQGLAAGRSDFTAAELSDGRMLAVGGITRSGAAAPGPDPHVVTGTAEMFTP